MKRIIVSLWLLVYGVGGAYALDPLVNALDYDTEYELDLMQNYIRSDDLWEWLSSENAFRITGGSLEIRHIFQDRRLKLRLPLIEDRFFMRYQHEVYQVTQYEITRDEIELEWNTCGLWYASVIGEPTYHKSEIDIGWAVRYGHEEGNSVKLTYMLNDYDSNYAYSTRSTNEGFERFYRDYPYEWRLRIASSQYPVRLWFEGWYEKKWTQDVYDLVTPANNAVRLGSSYFFETQVRWMNKPWSPLIDVTGYYRRAGEFFYVARPSEDHLYWERRLLIRPHVYIYAHPRFDVDVGMGAVTHKGEDVYAADPARTYVYENYTVMPFCNTRFTWNKNLILETGFIHTSIDERKYKLFSTQEISRESRLRLALDIIFSENAYLQIITGWEVDKEDWGKFAFFDGGNIQFQITW